jgi:ribulose-bisphosphate carboxylase small chain
MAELAQCRATFGNQYIRLTAFDSTAGTESIVLSIIVNRPQVEPGFRLVRSEEAGRTVRYSIESYAVQGKPEGARY